MHEILLVFISNYIIMIKLYQIISMIKVKILIIDMKMLRLKNFNLITFKNYQTLDVHVRK